MQRIFKKFLTISSPTNIETKDIIILNGFIIELFRLYIFKINLEMSESLKF